MDNLVVHFTRGFDLDQAAKSLLPTSIVYLKEFEGRGYYVFVQDLVNHEFLISGFLNEKPLTFLPVTHGGHLLQAEVQSDAIHKGKNQYTIILQHKNDMRADSIVLTGEVENF